MFDREANNFRKEWLRNKHKKSERKFVLKSLAKCNKQLKNNKYDCYTYKEKIESLIYLSKFKEADIFIDNIFCDIVPFDKNFKSYRCEISSEVLQELYFYRGFVKAQLNNYKGALQEYDKANQLSYILRDISFNRDKVCYEIELINKKLYGFVEGNKKNKEYFSDIVKNHPDDFYSLKHLARANYFIDTEEALKNYKALLKDCVNEKIYNLYFEKKKTTIKFLLLAIVKCNLKIWKTKKTNKQKEILKYLKKADKEIKNDTIWSNFHKKEAKIFLNYYKFLFYKMAKETEKVNKYFSIEKEKYKKKMFLQRCYLYPRTKLDKIIKGKTLSEQDRLLGLKELFCNHNISFKYFKSVYDKWNVKLSKEYIEELKNVMEDEKEGKKRLKYLTDKTGKLIKRN